MAPSCQVPEPFAIAVSGPAGSGKSTLGRAIATTLRAPMVDLDTLTNPLLDGLPEGLLGDGGHWLASVHGERIRQARYAALRAVASEMVETAGRVVLVAPFTSELGGGTEWDLLLEAVKPAALHMVHLVGDDLLFAGRRSARGERRDQYRAAGGAVLPAVPALEIDACLSTAQQRFRALREIGFRSAPDASNPVFSADFDAFLFDLDGTLIDSTASVIRCWTRLGEEFGVAGDLGLMVHANHGKPARTLLGAVLRPEDQARAFERVTELEVGDAVSARPIPGAAELFASLPDDRRAVVTSGSRRIATARLEAAGLPVPRTLVTADDVSRGKPDPEPFVLAAARLGVDPRRCLVLEDAEAGIAAARAAGCTVVAVRGTSEEPELRGASLTVDGLDALRALEAGSGAWRLTVNEYSATAEGPASGRAVR